MNWRGMAEPAHDDRAQRGEIVRMGFEVTVQPHPDGRDAGGEGDALVLDQLGDIGGLKMAAGETRCARPSSRRRRECPSRWRETSARFAGWCRARRSRRRRSCASAKLCRNKRAVRVQDAFGMASGSGGVAGGGGGIFIERRPRIRRAAALDRSSFVIEAGLGGSRAHPAARRCAERRGAGRGSAPEWKASEASTKITLSSA